MDNHDVTRIATILTDKGCLRPIYGLLFGMPGVPSVYYGSEWAWRATSATETRTLRPAVEKPEENDLTAWSRRWPTPTRAARRYAGAATAMCWSSLGSRFLSYADGERVLAGHQRGRQSV